MLTKQELLAAGMTLSSVEMDIHVPAAVDGEPGYASFDVLGNGFYLIECAGELEIKTDATTFKTYRKSTGEEFPGDQAFQRIEIRNRGARTRIKLWAGWGRYIDRRFELLEADTRAVGWDDEDQAIPAMDFVEFVPRTGEGYLRRKSILITNLDPNENLRVQDVDGNNICTVFARTSITLPVSDVIRIGNNTGANISCNVGEVYYVESSLITTAS